jgi:hypothetical protein
MAWRKWVVRGLVFGCLGGLTFLGLVYQYLTNPEAIRRKVLARLQADLVGVNVSIDSARLRLFGGITVQEVRLARRDDLDKSDFLYVPAAVLYHDKEHLLAGKLSLRKIEVQRPRLRAVRNHDGRWNLAGLLGPSDPSQPMPTIVIKQGTLVIEDRLAAPGTAPLEIKDIHLTLINDPLPTVTFEGDGYCEVAGRVHVHGDARRGGHGHLTLDFPELSVGPELIQRLAAYAPDTTTDFHGLQAKGTLKATISWGAGADSALGYLIRGKLDDGTFNHNRLPWPLERLHGSFACADGKITNADLHAVAGATTLDLTLEELDPARAAAGPWADALKYLHLTIRHVTLDKELFKYLPDLKSYQDDYSPVGKVNVDLKLQPRKDGRWQKDWILEAEDLTVLYSAFRYPVHKVRGTITLTQTGTRAGARGQESGVRSQGSGVRGQESGVRSQGVENSPSSLTPDFCLLTPAKVAVDLRGEASGRPIFFRGTIEGDDSTAAVKLDLWGNDLPVNDQLFAALPEGSRQTALSFAPTGLVDFRVFMRKPRGPAEVANRFLVHLHHGTVCYQVFPLPLTDVKGTLDIQPDHWEFQEFVGQHKDSTIRASGRSHPLPPPAVSVRVTTPTLPPVPVPVTAERVSLIIEGENLPLDETFRKALAPGREELARAMDTFALTGRMNFNAHIDDLPNQPRDIDVTVRVGGCRMQPTFFPYPLEEVAATVRYAKGSVWVADFHGRHGSSQLGIKRGTVIVKKEGGFWARLDEVAADPLVPDAELKRALPPVLRHALEVSRLTQPVGLSARKMVLDQPPEAGLRPVVYWDGTLRLDHASLQAGVECSGLTGQVSCQGLYNGQQLDSVVGNVFLEEATVLGQPLRRVNIPLAVWKGSPDILRLPNMNAQFFGGTLGGEARIEFGSIFRYEVLLRATHVELEQFGRHNFKAGPVPPATARGAAPPEPAPVELSGLATAALHLTGEGTDPSGLKGNGRLDVPSGKLYRLPLLLDLLKWLGLRLPDRTAFEQAHATFAIDGPRVQINQVDLYGSAISVRGQGSMKLDGSDLNIDLNADWGRMASPLPPLFKIKVRGRVGEVRFEKQLVPVVTEPARRIWNGLLGSSKN